MGLIKAFRNLFKGLDMDTNFKMVKQDNYLDALDITDVDRNKLNLDIAIQPNPSTKYAFDIGYVSPVSKTYHVEFELPTGETDVEITFYVKHRNITWTKYVYTYIPAGTDGGTAVGMIDSEFQAQYDSTIPYPTFDHNINNVNTTATKVSFDIYFPHLEYDDYTFSATYGYYGGGALDVACYPLNDAISVDKEGTPKVIAFAQCDDKLFVFSTTGTNEPQQLANLTDLYDVNLNPTSVQQIVYGLSGVSFGEINNGEEFNLVYENQVGDILYGNYILNDIFISPIIRKTIANIGKLSSFPYSPLPGPAIDTTSPAKYIKGTKYPRTVSCIGVAEKNPITEEWTYTELLRSTNLNFRSYKQIEASVVKANDGYILRWTDNLNPMRCLYYRGAFVNQGFLYAYNPENNYNLDTINDASKLILSSNVAKVAVGTSLDITNVSRKIHGTKNEGNYQAFVRFLTYDDQYSIFSPASNITTIYKDVTAPSSVFGGNKVDINPILKTQNHNSTVASNSALIINVSGINPSLYKEMQVAIVQTVEDSWLFYALPNEPINGKTSIEIIDDGYNPRSYVQLDATLLNELSFNIKTAQNLTVFDGYTIASNVELAPRYDLTEWAKTIQVGVTYRPTNYTTSSIQYGIYGQYTDFGSYTWLQYATDERMSYAPFETVRVGIKIWFKGVGAPSVYWIDDVTIDNTYLSTYDIGYSGSLDVKQFYLQLTNINLDYILPDGSVLRDIVEHIKIVRAEVPKEMMFMGFGIPAIDAFPYYTPSFNLYYQTPISETWTSRMYVISPDLEVTKEKVNTDSNTRLYYFPTSIGYGLDLNLSPTIYEAVEMKGYNNAANDWNTSTYPLSADYVSFYSSSGVTQLTTTYASQKSWRPALSINFNSNITVPATTRGGLLYYVKPIQGDKFPSIYSTKFYTITHDDIDINTIETGDIIKVFSGDFFPQVQYYLSSVEASTINNRVVGFPCLNRYNQQLRSGYFPGIALAQYRGISFDEMNTGNGDPYTVSTCFLPLRQFQNQTADNFLTPYYPKQETGIYWSLKSLQTALFGSNRIFKFANNKVLEQTYGQITGLIPLLGITSQGILLCLQEKRVTLQFFDNTANLISDAGALLIGNGKVMERRGTDLTNYGCADKWSIIKGITKTGKETAYWFCSWANAFMRFGDDGTSNISESGFVDAFLNINTKYTMLDNNKTPAHKFGAHGAWDSLNNRAIWTFRLAPKYTEYSYEKGYNANDFVSYDYQMWGFENFPVLYRAKIGMAAGEADPTDETYWEKIEGYNAEYFKFFTIVYSEDSNTFKTFFTHLPLIYGAMNNSLLSPSPRNENIIYEHSAGENEAMYYSYAMIQGGDWQTISPNLLVSTNIGSTIPFTYDISGYYAIPEHTKIVFTLQGKNYSIVRRVDNNTVEFENLDTDDVVPSATGDSYTLYLVNCQDPYIQPIINEYVPRYFSFAGIEIQSDDTIKRVEYNAFTDSLSETYTESFTNKGEFEYFQGRGLAQIKQDTKNNPTDNEASDQFVEGQVIKTKLKFRWGKKNKINNFVVNMVEQNKRFQ